MNEDDEDLIAPGESFPDEAPLDPASDERAASSSAPTTSSGWVPERPTGVPALAGLVILLIVGGAIYAIVNAGPEEIDEPDTIGWSDGLSSVQSRTIGELGHLDMDTSPERVRQLAGVESGSEVTLAIVVARQVSRCVIHLSPGRIRSIRCPVRLHTEGMGPAGMDATVAYLEAKYGDSTHLGQVPARMLEGSSAKETERLTAWQWRRDDLTMTLFARRQYETTDEVDGYLVVERAGADSDDSPGRQAEQ